MEIGYQDAVVDAIKMGREGARQFFGEFAIIKIAREWQTSCRSLVRATDLVVKINPAPSCYERISSVASTAFLVHAVSETRPCPWLSPPFFLFPLRMLQIRVISLVMRRAFQYVNCPRNIRG